MTRRHVLILGGTAEAASLAAGLADRFGATLQVTSSLAGRTERPAPLPGAVRIGSFGGADGLADWLRARRVDLVVDATHPFAAAISANAVDACARLCIPRLRLQRPAWRPHPLDRWIEVETLDDAARALAHLGSKRAFLTVGVQELAPFAALDTIWFLIRLIDPPRTKLCFGPHEIVLGRGPFAPAEERLLLARHRIDALVTKASGGSATEAKLIAAREADLPVIMIRRPPPPDGPLVESAEATLDWVTARL
jgi:precorrin-6A/cobalt-precorrin-6A reductase